MKKQYVRLLCGALCLLMLALAGCQAVGGTDAGKILVNALQASSYEGTQTISISMKSDEQAAAGKPDLSVLNEVTIVMSEVKKQGDGWTSMKGKLKLAKAIIPFHLTLTKNQMAVLVEGAAKPVVFEWNIGDSLGKLMGGGGGLAFDLGELNDPDQLARLLGPFVINHMPNPATVKSEQATATVNGKSESFTKLHAEIKGSELAGLVEGFAKNVLADQEGMDQLVKDALTLLFGKDYSPLIGNIAGGAIKETLPKLFTGLEQMVAEDKVKGYLTDTNTLKVDLYADAEQQLRKADYELSIKAPAGAAKGFQELTVKSSSERWNIGGTVQADILDLSNAVKLGEGKGMPDFLRTLDKKSDVYKLLKDEVKIYRKNIRMPLGDGLPGENEVRPYLNEEKGTTMVPVRFVTEKLDAEVLWDGDKMEATIIDLYTGKKLVFTIDSDTVLIDGKEVQLEAAAVLQGGSTYVPVRIIAESLGGAVGWEEATRTVSIVRD